MTDNDERVGAAKDVGSSKGASLIIRCYNEEEHIGKLLTGVLAQTLKEVEIILVDSGSSDATLAIANRFPVKIVRIAPEQFSFGRSLNLGCEQASHELLVVASAHVYPVYADWLERLLAPFANPQIALAYGKQRGSVDSHFSEQQIFERWYPNHAEAEQAHPFCNNANAALRRSLWLEHPYDESLSGLEDVDWARWAVNSGYKIAYAPEAEIIHIHHETRQGVYNRYRREAMAFKRIFPEEKFGLGDCLRLAGANMLSDAWQAKRQGILLKNLGAIGWFRWMQFWGTYQGYRQAGPLNGQLRQTFYYPGGFRSNTTSNPRGNEPIQYDEQ